MGFQYCSMDIDGYVFSRQCFMTGEYCSKQLSIQRERQRLHREGKINAFVVMSFTDMTDVMYEWRIQSYVKSLAKNLYFRSENGIKKQDIEKIDFPVKQLMEPGTDLEKRRRFSNYLSVVSGEDKLEGELLNKLPEDYKEIKFSSLCCYAGEDTHKQRIEDDWKNKEEYYPEFKVDEINVIRADSNPSSNFVICNRVCQQMQIADLVVVDVSDENTNVFYELGMAMGFQKLILPICYSESYFRMELPEGVKEEQRDRLKRLREEKNSDQDSYKNYNDLVERLEHHIDCYPWQRQLFEHFGMRYKQTQYSNQSGTTDTTQEKENSRYPAVDDVTRIHYLAFDEVTKKEFGFHDLKYDRFPYRNRFEPLGKSKDSEQFKDSKNSLGHRLYDHLSDSFNSSQSSENTLVVYTMERFLNSDEGWRCIANYYRAYVSRLKNEDCFCGDRVGLLIQSTAIAEPVKNAEERRHLLYNIGEIIQIGMNQATFLAHREIIKPSEYLEYPKPDNESVKATNAEANKKNGKISNADIELSGWKDSFRRFTKEYISNRSFPIFPRDPVYVYRVDHHVHDDLFKNSIENIRHDADLTDQKQYVNNNGKDMFFCLYHVMLRNLKYVSEIAVDVTHNSVQSLFWLGAAHASGVYAITIRHDSTEEEKKRLASAGEERGQKLQVNSGRSIFDISGLWTAVLHAYDTKGFYKQLERVQMGIEQRSKLLLRDSDGIQENLTDAFWEPVSCAQEDGGFEERSKAIFRDRYQRESELMESYYRNRFWRPMLRRNQLEIYVCQDDIVPKMLREESQAFSRSYVPAWDIEAISQFSLYLSKRKMIGEYKFSLTPRAESQCGEKYKEKTFADLEKKNYICIGAHVNPYSKKVFLSRYLNQHLQSKKHYAPHFCTITSGQAITCGEQSCNNIRGFSNGDGFSLLTQLRTDSCKGCKGKKTEDSKSEQEKQNEFRFINCDGSSIPECTIDKEGEHFQLGQLLLWREESCKTAATEAEQGIVREPYSFRASLVGTSGPATSALSALFVDETQKKDMLSGDKEQLKKWRKGDTDDLREAELFPLSALQREIRSIILARYRDLLNENLKVITAYSRNTLYDDEDEKTEYIQRVLNATELYLSTVLYRRFFPFLSHEDEARICNGLHLFIRKAMSNTISPFARVYATKEDAQEKTLDYSEYSAIILNKDVEKAVDEAEKTLRTLLDSLQAVEVFYKVRVSFEEDTERDINGRKTESIELVKRSEHPENGIGKNGDESKTYFIRCIYKQNVQKSEAISRT